MAWDHGWTFLVVEAAEKIGVAMAAPKGASDFETLAVSLKRCPDTELKLSESGVTFIAVLPSGRGLKRQRLQSLTRRVVDNWRKLSRRHHLLRAPVPPLRLA